MNLPLETTVNDTEISRKSFQKSRKLLSFGKRTIQPKILKIPGARFNGKNLREKISKILVYLAKLSSFLKFWKMLFRSLLKVAENSNRAQNSGLVSFVQELLLPSKLHKTVPFNEDGRESPEPVIKIGFEEMELKFLYHSVKMFRCPWKFSTRTTRKLAFIYITIRVFVFLKLTGGLKQRQQRRQGNRTTNKTKGENKEKIPRFLHRGEPIFYISMQHLFSSSHDDNGG